ncbi:Adenosylmethionine-8-amino-7-oxononanoate aminotransferase [Rhodococcus koreensis]|uniref:Adenosylmethionine-8-amino-7-oxononanoate aminotransferase n=1 Tax=Rhodococcus koreensis TaxID=99653 RepID=A0A1H4MD48_9NOCA|nr:aspartate aminotransferase family protein [Rhodococcus koreensis]SEB80455.1 Adenosylmethionine-8-amino-7-oxononanoate aminotransferase [Rhodococcus koreensis]
MSTNPVQTVDSDPSRHLWMHFSNMGAYAQGVEVPVIVRGEGCYVWDQHGNRYLDGLSSLYCVNVGHGRTELAEAAAKQATELAFFPTWSFAHPRAIELATKIADLAPADLNRVFFVGGGGEAVDSAFKLARQYHKIRGKAGKYKVISRNTAYHGTTLGALAATALSTARAPFEPLPIGGSHVTNTNVYRLDPQAVDTLAEAIQERIEFEGPDTVAAVILEPVQNSGGCFVPPEGYFQRVRQICDQYDVLLISDEVICAFGRLGEWFGAQRFDYVPDIITTAKGLTSAYAPMGAVIASDRVIEPFLTDNNVFAHGVTFGGHPVASAVALANIELMESEKMLENVRANEPVLRGMLESLRDIALVGDVRGAGYFWAIELVKDPATRQRFSPAEGKALLAFLAPELYRRGLICRADMRGDLVVQLAPPLIAGPPHFAEIETILRSTLVDAAALSLPTD